jgi:thymidine phosphorylase
LDVKIGSGAFMKTQAEAETLARALVDVANGAGCPTAALITDMDQPLAPALGNAVEVAACMEVLSGNRDAAPRLYDLTVALGAQVLALHGEANAEARLKNAISSGQAMTHFAGMIVAMGGPPDMAEDWRTHLPAAPVVGDIMAPHAGVVTAIDGEALGFAVVALGGGRKVESDRINPAVGLTNMVCLGEKVVQNQPLCMVHAASEDAAQAAAVAVQNAVTIGRGADIAPLIRKEVS